jgi:hypothetical protein
VCGAQDGICKHIFSIPQLVVFLIKSKTYQHPLVPETPEKYGTVSESLLPKHGVGMTSRSQTPPLVEEEAPFQNTQKSEKKNTVMGPDGTRKQD